MQLIISCIPIVPVADAPPFHNMIKRCNYEYRFLKRFFGCEEYSAYAVCYRVEGRYADDDIKSSHM